MKKFTVVFVLTLIFSCSSFLYASEITILRVSCMQSDIGTKIYLNGKFKGECDGSPVDIMAPSGSFTLRAYKQVDAEREQTYTTEGTLVAGVAKRINIHLSAPKLTAVAQKAYDRAEKLRREKAQKEEQLRLTKAREKEAKHQLQLAAEELKSARGGDLAAMAAIAGRYETGNGVKQDSAEAAQWRQKRSDTKAAAAAQTDLQAAKSGDITAMESMERRYRRGDGVEKNSKLAKLWQEKVEFASKTAKQKKIATEKRRAEARTAQRLADAKKKFSYTKITDSFFKNGMKSRKDPFEGLFMTTVSPAITAAVLILDLVSTPTRMSEWKKISKDITGHASAWAKPDSMMAKAYRQQLQGNGLDKHLIFAKK